MSIPSPVTTWSRYGCVYFDDFGIDLDVIILQFPMDTLLEMPQTSEIVSKIEEVLSNTVFADASKKRVAINLICLDATTYIFNKVQVNRFNAGLPPLIR
jgi:hypothetical protein